MRRKKESREYDYLMASKFLITIFTPENLWSDMNFEATTAIIQHAKQLGIPTKAYERYLNNIVGVMSSKALEEKALIFSRICSPILRGILHKDFTDFMLGREKDELVYVFAGGIANHCPDPLLHVGLVTKEDIRVVKDFVEYFSKLKEGAEVKISKEVKLSTATIIATISMVVFGKSLIEEVNSGKMSESNC